MPERKKPILSVDFDGVVHQYVSPWSSAEIISDGPVPGALRWLWKATEWFTVVIYSSRSITGAGRHAMRMWLRAESLKEFGPGHPMCDRDADGNYPIAFPSEKPPAFLTIDDRAITFDGDWSEIEPADLLSFRPWNRRAPLEPARG